MPTSRSLRTLLALSALLCAPLAARAEVEVSVNVGAPVETATFHERLSPYGHWVDTPDYGEVWVPNSLHAGWRPYSDGRWVLTEYGWTFVSDDPWGWATWHYGNWVMAGMGWVWVPGRVWAPAWVNWRYGGGYACWSPAPPRGFRVAVYAYNSPAWVVVEQRHFTQPIATVTVSGAVAGGYVQRSQPLAQVTVSNGMAVNPGPQAHVVAAATGQNIQPVAANAVVGHGTAAIAHAPPAPASPPHVAQAMQQQGWKPLSAASQPHAAHNVASTQHAQPGATPQAAASAQHGQPSAAQPAQNVANAQGKPGAAAQQGGPRDQQRAQRQQQRDARVAQRDQQRVQRQQQKAAAQRPPPQKGRARRK